MSRSKWAIVVVVLVVLAAVATAYAAGKTAAPVQEVVRAKRFELVDAEGRVRIEIGMGGVDRRWQTPGVRLLDQKGNVRATLEVYPQGHPNLTLRDEKGEVRAMLALAFDDSPVIWMYDEKGKTRAVGGLGSDGSPILTLRDKEGEAIWSAP